MKNISIVVLALAGIVSLGSCSAKKEISTKAKNPSQQINKMKEKVKKIYESGLDLAYMDTSVRPQDDFFNFVNGNWMKNAVIPSDKASWGSFNILREEVDVRSLDILNNVLKQTYPANSDGQKIQALYGTFIDWNKRNELGISPIQSKLSDIDDIETVADLQNYLIKVTPERENPFYEWRVGADMKNSTMNAVYLGGPSLGLGKDYYQKVNESNAKTLEEYQNYVSKILTVLGDKNPSKTAQSIVDFEKKLAGYLLTLEQGRDANLRYNPKTIVELSDLVKSVKLPEYLKKVGVNTDKVIISELRYYQNMDSWMTHKNIPIIKAYMKYDLLNGYAQELDEKLDQIKFNFYSKYLQGQQKQRSMDKRGLEVVNRVLGEPFGKLYVEKYFSVAAKEKMKMYIDYLKKSFKVHIENLDWMSPATKEKALEKLHKFSVKIAYPDQWKDYSKLQLISPSEGGTYYSNMQKIQQWQYQKDLKKVGKPVDKKEWGMPPQTVNAYYSSSNNEIVFPAAILQPPFFNFEADPAVNFGGIGAVIGHEISHGFDDSGSRFDGDGNLNNWWTDEDRKNFDAKVEQLAAQYDKYEPVPGIFINGKFTSGENIGDLGGVAVAYSALQMYLKDKGDPGKIDGFTQDQRFFISWATVWRTKSTESYMANQVKTDPHSPGYFRSFAPLVNQDSFQNAFNIKPSDKLYVAPEKRIKIW